MVKHRLAMQNGFLVVLEASQPHPNGIGELAPIASSFTFKGLASDAMAVNVGSKKWHIARVHFGVDVCVIRSTAMVTSSATLTVQVSTLSVSGRICPLISTVGMIQSDYVW